MIQHEEDSFLNFFNVYSKQNKTKQNAKTKRKNKTTGMLIH